MKGDAFVTLCTCYDTVSVQSVRAALEARGITVVIQGSQAHDVLGGVYGAMIRPRILVPREDLPLAAELAGDVMGDLELDFDAPEASDAGLEHPMRPVPVEGDDAGDDFGHDAGHEVPAFDDAATWDDSDPRDAAAPADDLAGDSGVVGGALRLRGPKSLAVPVLLGFLGLSVGFVHIYAGKPNIGAALLVTTVVGASLALLGHPIGMVVVGGVWLFDLIGGLATVVASNRMLPAASEDDI